MMAFLQMIGLLVLLGLFGFATAIYVLRLRGPAVLMLACTLGPVFLLVGANSLGYLLPIRAALVIVPTLMLIWTVIVFGLAKRDRQLITIQSAFAGPSRAAYLAIIGAILLGGFAYARDGGSDLWTPAYLAVPAQIMEGNFPVRDPVNPWDAYGYHYGPALLSAAMSFLTGLPVMAATVPQPLMAAAGIVLGAAAIAWKVTGSGRAAAVSGVLAFMGAGLFWLYGIYLIQDVFSHYLLHQPIVPDTETALRWLTPTIRLMHAQSLLAILGHRPIALGAGLLFPFLYLLLEAFSVKKITACWPWVLLCILYGAGIALCLETSFAVLYAATGLFIGLLLFCALRRQETDLHWKQSASIAGCIFLPLLVLAFFQGGVLSVHDGDATSASFAVGFDGRLHIDGGPMQETIALWEPLFLRDFGLQIGLMAWGIVYAWKRKKTSSFLLFLGLLAGLHFLIPVFVRFLPRAHEMNRFFFVAFGLSSILIGIVLSEKLLASSSRLKRNTGYALLTCLLFAGILNAAVRITFPSLRAQASPLFPTLPSISSSQEVMYRWISSHTTIDDYFYLHSGSRLPGSERALFAYHVGRFVIETSYAKPKAIIEPLTRIEEQCDIKAVQGLSIRYLVIENAERAEWFSAHCTPSDWTVQYDGAAAGKTYPRIFSPQ